MTSAASLVLLWLAAAPAESPPPSEPAAAGPVEGRELVFEKIPFKVLWVDLDQADIRVLWTPPPGRPNATLSSAQQALGGKALALTNAGIFEANGKPTGLLVADGVERAPLNTTDGTGNFYTLPNGVFYIDEAGAHVVETHGYPQPPTGVKQATQSGPLLLWGGKIHLGLAPASRYEYVRSGIGVLGLRKVAIVLSGKPVNLYTLARFFRDGLECTSALYLDGTISRLYAPTLQLNDLKSAGPFSGIIAVLPRAPGADAGSAR